MTGELFVKYLKNNIIIKKLLYLIGKSKELVPNSVKRNLDKNTYKEDKK